MAYKRKYKKGKPIKSLAELYQQEFIYFQHKITHRGWFGSWQLSLAQSYINRGFLYRADKVNESGD